MFSQLIQTSYYAIMFFKVRFLERSEKFTERFTHFNRINRKCVPFLNQS